MRGLGRHGATHCFSKRTGVRWVQAMSRELDVVLLNLPAALALLPEYIKNERDAKKGQKAQDLLHAISTENFKVTAAFFGDILAILCIFSKVLQPKK